MKFFFLPLLIYSVSSGAKSTPQPEWQIVHMNKGNFRLQHTGNKKLQYPIRMESPGYRYQETRPIKGKPLSLLIYFAGSAGTYELVKIYRAVVFNTKKQIFYGDFPFRIVSSTKGKTYPDTVFSFNKKSFTVFNEVTGLKKTVTY